MKEYIEREAVVQDIIKAQESLESNIDKEWTKNKPCFKGLAWANRIILETPAADVEPVKHGEWREEFRSQKSLDGYFYWNTPQKKVYVCSICGREEVKKEPYCNCGADMSGGNE